jgi:hypothetical protein
MTIQKKDPIFGAAILKLSMMLKGLADEPGFRVVYFGSLKDLGLTDTEVNAYIDRHRPELEAHILKKDD